MTGLHVICDFDAGAQFGESVEKDMITVRIGLDWWLVAVVSPAYLAAHGTPEHPQDLVRHACINMGHETAGGTYVWEFPKSGQEIVTLERLSELK